MDIFFSLIYINMLYSKKIATVVNFFFFHRLIVLFSQFSDYYGDYLSYNFMLKLRLVSTHFLKQP